MSSNGGFPSSSDDGDVLVTEPLQSFSSPGDPEVEPTQIEADIEPATQIDFAVEIPRVDGLDEYRYLPGHSVVRRILGKESGDFYKVELESSDRELISSPRLHALTNGPESLSSFKNHSNPSQKKARHEGKLDKMVGSNRRSRRRPQSTGFVNSNAISFSSSEDDLAIVVQSSDRPHQKLRQSIRHKPPPSSNKSEDGYSSSSLSDVYIRRRSARLGSRRETSKSIVSRNSTDEETSGDYPFDSTVSRKRKMGKTTRRSSKRLKSRQLENESDRPQQRGTRFSKRTRDIPRRDLRERRESDISENESTLTMEKRYAGARELFDKIPKENGFRLRHRNVCDTCSILDDDDQKGPLVFCQGCTSAFHRTCLGYRGSREHLVTKIANNKFVLQCRRCIGVGHKKDSTAPHQGHCSKCNAPGLLSQPLRDRLTARQEQHLRESNSGIDPITAVDMKMVDNPNEVLFRCKICSRAFHFEHLPPKPKAAHAQEGEDSLTADIANSRFDEYIKISTCQDCEAAPGEIEVLVAWRPTNPDSHVLGSTADSMQEGEKEYLIKWKGKSYYRTSWMPGSWVWGVTTSSMRKAFFKSPKNLKAKLTTEDAIPEEFLRVDIVFDVRYSNIVSSRTNRTQETDIARVKEVKEAYVKFKGLSYEDSVWESMPDPSDVERWLDFKKAYDDWVLRAYVHVPNPVTLRKHLSHVRNQDFESTLETRTQPDTLTGGEIMEYQIDGLNWLLYMWYKQENSILADEMGLGKTIQVIALFASLIQHHQCWPFLVVCPNSTCPNWRREIKKWAPSLRVVTYYGSSTARRLAHDYEMFPEGSKDLRCHVLVTSYETLLDEKSRKVLMGPLWAGLVVDEGHRLKNDKTQLYEALSRIKFPFKLLLTGTPLQNNIRELFNLIQFCDPTKEATSLEAEYETLTKENLPKLHEIIRPFFLRRTKTMVLDFLPPVAQIIVPVSMSLLQKKLYKSILAKNSQLIKSIFKNSSQKLKQTERHNLSNILMQLRKCLTHPFVYSKEIEERSSNAVISHRNLVEASGKLKLLELMLPKLKDRGHRVLLFSQFLDNIDIVEDFLDGLGLLHRRLDGSMGSLEKQKQIDDYNAPNSPYFAFLLSTRAGGVGINLATADTVIIMDPDFNPHQDIQALSRAHRIGQQKKVLVFQLMTRGSAEEKIMQIGKKKMALDHVLIQQINAEDEVLDLESILRHGAEALFDDDETGDIHYDTDSVDKLLDRSHIENTQTADDGSAESQFSFARVWANNKSTLEDRLGDSEASTPKNTVWEKILSERERAAAEEAATQAQVLGRGKRKRNAVDYAVVPIAVDQVSNPSPQKPARGAESDTEYNTAVEGTELESELDTELDIDAAELGTGELPRKQPGLKGRPFQRVDVSQIGPPRLDGSSDFNPSSLPCLACYRRHPVGYCPLKLAGVEHCGLCGIAHMGFQRTCPHLHSEAQLDLMLESLKESTEAKDLVDQARHYVRDVRRDLARKKRQSSKASDNNTNSANERASDSVLTIPQNTLTGPPDHKSNPPGRASSNTLPEAVHQRSFPDPIRATQTSTKGH
ncbi:PHD/FYVE-zinc-finger like domain containing protein [Elaphomyces granulatus]